MIRDGMRGVWVFLLLAPLCYGDAMDDAARALAKAVAARLGPGETYHVTARNLSSLAAAEAARARTTFELALRKPASRSATPAEVIFTVTENVREYLFVAEIRRGADRTVEIAGYRPEPAAKQSRMSLERRLIWEQDDPILDLYLTSDHMFVLGPASLTLYTHIQTGWQRTASQPLPETIASLRDPRGRLEVAANSLVVFLPGVTCKGTWQPELEVTCDATSTPFLLSEQLVRFSSGRNTLEAEGWPPFYSYSRVRDGGRTYHVLTELDGKLHVYDPEKKPAGLFDGWGSDMAPATANCGSETQLLITSADDDGGADSVAVYDIGSGKPAEASDPAEFSGPVTALWSSAAGAMAVTRNATTGRYAAYNISLDCRH